MGIFDRFSQPDQPLIPVQAAAGQVVRGGSPATPKAVLRRQQKWQERVLVYADSVPEVSHASDFVAKTTGRVMIEVQDGSPANEAVIANQLEHFPLGRAGELVFLVGECLVMFKYDRMESHTVWKVLAPGEYQIPERNKPLKIKGKSGRMEEVGPEWRYFRIWDPCRRDRFAATSPHRAMLDLLESMYVHQLADAAIATSRLAGAGILFLPNDLAPSMPRTSSGRPEPGSMEEIIENLSGAMVESLRNRSSEDAYVPFMLTGDGEYGAMIRHILMERADDADAFASRMEEYAKRYGRSVPLPMEVVTGMGPANHWTAWKVDENTWSYYLAPLVDLILSALNEKFADPLAATLGDPGATVTLHADPKNVIAKPDRTDAAIRARQLGILSAEATLRAAGFDPVADIEPDTSMHREGGRLEELPSRFRDSAGRASGEDISMPGA